MPVLSPLFASATEATTTASTFGVAAETAALANGVPYLVVVTAGTISTNSNSTPAEAEATFGGTRYGFTRYQVGFSGAPDSGSGGHIATAFRVQGDGSSTVAVRHRRQSGSGTVATTAHIICIPLDSLTEGTHYWRAEAANSDTLVQPTAGAGYIGSGDQVDVTPAATGNFLVLACGELGFTAGHSAADQGHMRCRVTEDPLGTPTAYNLMRNTIGAIAGPEVQFEGGDPFDLEIGQRFLDVVELTAGTTYRFEVEREQVSGAANTGYRRERVFVFDLSVWPEFHFARGVTGQNGQNQTFDTVAASAPSAAIDYAVLGAVLYQNNNSWIRAYLETDPTGTPVQLSGPFGLGLPDTGNAATDDYGVIGLQWHNPAVAGAVDYALHCVADLTNCRWGAAIGDFPNPNDGVATLTIAWGMETSTVGAPSGDMTGSSAGSGAASGSMTGSGALGGSSAGAGAASGSMTGDGALSGSSAGSGTASGSMGSDGSMTGSSAGSGTAGGSLQGDGAMSGSTAGSGAASGTMTSGSVVAPDATVAFVGNSFTQNYGGLPAALQHLLDARLPSNTTSLGPPPYLATTIGDTDGWYSGMTLGGMALYPTIDQSTGGSTDALDAIDSVANDAYDWVVLTSGFRQEFEPGDPQVSDDTAVERVVLPGAGGTGAQYEVCLEVTRRVVSQLQAEGSTAQVIVRMTQEGYNVNTDTDLSDLERITRLQCLAARQMLSEGVADFVSPDFYVWGRLTAGAHGPVGSGVTAPVAAYAGLTHSNSSQPGGANLAWLQRSQGDVAPFNTNAHQNALGTIVNAWIWGYALFGIDPRGDATFDLPTGLPHPLDDMIRADGARIYGGHNTGAGNTPYPGTPPDAELDLVWDATVRGQIQDIIVAAIDDWNNEETEFDGLSGSMSGSTAGSGTASGSLGGSGALSGGSAGAGAASGSLDGDAALGGSSAGSGAASGGLGGDGAMQGGSDGSGTAAGTMTDASGLSGSSGGTSSASGGMTGTGDMAGSSAGSSTAAALSSIPGRVTGRVITTDTVRPLASTDTPLPARTQGDSGMGTPWYVHPEDEGSILSELIVYPEQRDDRDKITQLQRPVDLSDASAVALEVWDGSAWVQVTGAGAVESEVLEATAEREAGTYYRLTFAPAAGALAAIEAIVGRDSHPRRWALTVTAGDLHLPSNGWDQLVFPALPPAG